MPRVDFVVHFRGLVGVPAVVSSKIACNSRRRPRSVSSTLFCPPPGCGTRNPAAPSERRRRPGTSAMAFVMVVRDKPVISDSRLMPPRPKSRALSATYQRRCASLRVDSTLSHRFSLPGSPRLDIHHRVENSPSFVQLVLARPLIKEANNDAGLA